MISSRVKIVTVLMLTVVAIVSIGSGYALTYTGTTTSTDNVNPVTLYTLNICEGQVPPGEGESPVIMEHMYLSNPNYIVDESGVHKVVIPTTTSAVMSDYTLLTDNDYDLGAHIRMWVIITNPLQWLFIDSITVTLDTIHGTETFTCGVSDGRTSMCTDVMALVPHETWHPFTLTVTYKESVTIDYEDREELFNSEMPYIVFAYDDIDPLQPPVEPEVDHDDP